VKYANEKTMNLTGGSGNQEKEILHGYFVQILCHFLKHSERQ